MPVGQSPSVPPEQHQLREHLEQTLPCWGVSYRHEDRDWVSSTGRHVITGWGTYIDRGHGRPPLRVWFDGLDHDIAIYGGYGRHTEYLEWTHLGSMSAVLDELTSALRDLLDAPEGEHGSRA